MAIYINGNVITLSGDGIKQAFRVKNGFFDKIGNDEEIIKLREMNEEIINLEGKTVVPGFNDAHMHFLNYAITKSKVSINNVASIEQMINQTKEYIKLNNINSNQWIISRGWNENLFKEKRLPSRFDLDKISTEHPIFFHRICGHIGVCNTKALEILNILDNIPIMNGGIIDVEDGKPTGIFRENAINLINEKIPPLSKEEIKKLLKGAFKDALKFGLTSIQTEDVGHAGSLVNLLEAYKELDRQGELPVRISLQLWLPSVEDIKEADKILSKVFNNEMNSYKEISDYLKIACVKLYQDGSLGGRTAAVNVPYLDTEEKGVAIYSQNELDKVTSAANEYDFPLAIHCIGDRASEMVLNSYEKLENKNLRNSIVHCQFTNKKLLNRFSDLHVIANVQPSFVMTDYSLVDKVIDKKVAEESYSWYSMINSNINVCFSSDAPIESFNPIQSIYAAVTRKDLDGNPKDGWYANESLSVLEALKCQTLGSAYMSGEENIKGSIEEGKYADFVILSHNILEVESDRIKDIKVMKTYVGGVAHA